MTTHPQTQTSRPVSRYAALVAGRRTKWAVLVFWLLLIAVAGSLGSKIGSVENNDAQTWLPAGAQSTQALAIAQQHFAGRDVSTAVVVYARAGGLTAADLTKISADRNLLISQRSAVGPISPVTASLIFHALGHPQIDRSLFLIGFLFLVALGVDYTIFLMSRAREEVQRRGHRVGVLSSLTLTGGVITSAGLVLAATFCVLAAIPTVGSLQEGLLIAVGVLLDTFLVRSLLVPALALDIGPRIWRPGHPEQTAPGLRAWEEFLAVNPGS